MSYLGLTREGRRLLLAIVEYAIANGYPAGPFERQLIRRLRGCRRKKTGAISRP